MSKVYLTTERFPDLTDVQFPMGTAVELIAPKGYRWRYTRTGQIEVYRYGLRERLDRVLDVNLLHVIAASSLVIGIAITVVGCADHGVRNMKMLSDSVAAERNAR